MSDMDIIASMGSQKFEPDLYSLQQILADVPTLTYEHPMLYALYLYHNKDKLTDQEKAKVRMTIDTLKHNRDVINNMNMGYMSRHEQINLAA